MTNLLTRRELESRFGFHKTMIYRKVAEGSYPMPIKVSDRAVRWDTREGRDPVEPERRDSVGRRFNLPRRELSPGGVMSVQRWSEEGRRMSNYQSDRCSPVEFEPPCSTDNGKHCPEPELHPQMSRTFDVVEEFIEKHGNGNLDRLLNQHRSGPQGQSFQTCVDPVREAARNRDDR